MTEDSKSAQDENKKFVEHYLATAFNDEWWDLLHDDAVFEFPYAPSLGVPDRFVGREKSEAYLRTMTSQLGDLKFENIVVTASVDPTVFFNEYTATLTTPKGTSYEQVYISKIQLRDGKVILNREFWDPARVTKAVGDYTGA